MVWTLPYKIGGIALGVVALYGGFRLWLGQHDKNVREKALLQAQVAYLSQAVKDARSKQAETDTIYDLDTARFYHTTERIYRDTSTFIRRDSAIAALNQCQGVIRTCEQRVRDRDTTISRLDSLVDAQNQQLALRVAVPRFTARGAVLWNVLSQGVDVWGSASYRLLGPVGLTLDVGSFSYHPDSGGVERELGLRVGGEVTWRK